jgi:hypothetical protein
MATANNAIRVSELDFLTIKENLKSFLRDQSEFQDFDFEGSGMSVLLDVLAYNTHYMGYYLNMVGNEMFLDTAQLRGSVISHAKNLNYVPTSSRGALVKATVVVTPSNNENQNTSLLTLDKYTKFLAQDIDGVNYQFLATDSNTTVKINNTFTFTNVFFKQGEVVTRQFLMEATNTTRRFEIPSANVDTSTIKMVIQASASNTHSTEYVLADDMTALTGNSQVYFIEENADAKYTFYFGDNIIGKKPDTGNIIRCTYFETVGSPANSISRFYQSDPIGGLFTDNVTITPTGSSYGGTNKETLEQVRFRAPYFYTAQNRAVTINDYETLIMKDYNNIESVSVWGGEDNDPIVYGKVYLSLKTRGNYALTNFEKEQIKKNLIKNRNVLTVTPEIVDPDYAYILIRGSVTYNKSITTSTAEELKAFVRAAISDYNDNELNTFSSTFRKAKLQNYIQNCERSITGSDIQILIQKRVLLDTNTAKNYTISYNLPLEKGDYNYGLYTFPRLSLYDFNNVERQVYYEEKPFSSTGVDSISILNAGINYISTPTVTITGDGSGATAEAIVRNGKISRIDMLTRGTDYTRAEVTLSGGGGSEGKVVARLEARFGTIRTFYYQDTGEKIILSEDVGTVNYDSGAVELNSFLALSAESNSYYDADTVTFNWPVEKEQLPPLRNRIFTIDLNDPVAVQIDMISEE